MIKVLSCVVDNGIGGIQNRILMVGENLRNYKIETILLTPKGEGDFSKTMKKKGFTVFRAPIESPKTFSSFNGILKNIAWFLSFPIAVVKIMKIIEKEKIDIVHVNGILCLQPVVASYLTKKPIVWHLISSIYPNFVVKTLRPIIKKWPTKIIFIADIMKDYYLGSNYPKEKVEVIYEPVNIDIFNPTKVNNEEKKSLKNKFGITDEYYVVGFVGNINPAKDLHTFINIANNIKQYNTKVKFMILGDKIKGHERYYESLKYLVKSLNLNDEIIFTGSVNHENIPSFLSIMDILLMTSSAEGTPLAILEAMALGKPVVASDVGGISEQIIDGVTGYLFPIKKTQMCSNIILDLLSSEAKRNKFGKNGMKYVQKKFSLDICVKRHRILYSKCIKKALSEI